MVGVVGTAGEWRKEKSIIWGGVGLEKKRELGLLLWWTAAWVHLGSIIGKC